MKPGNFLSICKIVGGSLLIVLSFLIMHAVEIGLDAPAILIPTFLMAGCFVAAWGMIWSPKEQTVLEEFL